jgi:hypothetical protein
MTTSWVGTGASYTPSRGHWRSAAEIGSAWPRNAIRRREHTSGGRLPVIAMTAPSREEDREACLAAGMDAFLPEPIHAADLWAVLHRIAVRDDGVRAELPVRAASGDRRRPLPG